MLSTNEILNVTNFVNEHCNNCPSCQTPFINNFIVNPFLVHYPVVHKNVITHYVDNSLFMVKCNLCQHTLFYDVSII